MLRMTHSSLLSRCLASLDGSDPHKWLPVSSNGLVRSLSDPRTAWTAAPAAPAPGTGVTGRPPGRRLRDSSTVTLKCVPASRLAAGSLS